MPQSHIETLPLRRRAGLVATVRTFVVTALARRRDRRHLARLDSHLLRDIGVESQDAAEECGKPFWRT